MLYYNVGPRKHCVGHGDGWGGHAGWMYEQTMDDVFSHAMLAVIFPRILLVAGSLWRYEKKRDLKSLINDYSHCANRLERAAQKMFHIEYPGYGGGGGASLTCPWSCKGGCTMTSRCGVAYTKTNN